MGVGAGHWFAAEEAQPQPRPAICNAGGKKQQPDCCQPRPAGGGRRDGGRKLRDPPPGSLGFPFAPVSVSGLDSPGFDQRAKALPRAKSQAGKRDRGGKSDGIPTAEAINAQSCAKTSCGQAGAEDFSCEAGWLRQSVAGDRYPPQLPGRPPTVCRRGVNGSASRPALQSRRPTRRRRQGTGS